MTMEKYSQSDDDLLAGLRNEEAQLMQEVARAMSGEKIATSQGAVEQRLASVRAKITSLDLANPRP